MNREPRAATLTKAIDVLSVLMSGPKSLSAIAKQTDLPKATIHRLLVGLGYKDLVIQIDGAGTYGLGPGCLRLAEAATKDGGGLSGVAMPVLERVWSETDETVTLHVRVGYQRLCVTEIISRGPLRYVSGVGSSAPLHVGSAGKVLLAFLTPAERARRPRQARVGRHLPELADRARGVAGRARQGSPSGVGRQLRGTGTRRRGHLGPGLRRRGRVARGPEPARAGRAIRPRAGACAARRLRQGGGGGHRPHGSDSQLLKSAPGFAASAAGGGTFVPC